MYQSTGVPRGVKGVQPPLNVFNCMFAQKYYTTSASVFIKHIIDQRKLLFLRRLVHTKNDVVQTYLDSYVHYAEFYGLCCKYNVDINMCSIHFIRYAVADHFYNIVLTADT